MDDVRTPTARQGLLRSALHPEWTVLWQTGRLDVAPDDDIDGIVDKIGRYLRLRRNPLLDRKDFFGRNQEEGRTLTSTSHPSSASTTDARTRTTFRPAALNVDTQGITAAASKSVASVTGSSLVSVTPACSGEYFSKTSARTSHWIACHRSARPMSHQRTQT